MWSKERSHYYADILQCGDFHVISSEEVTDTRQAKVPGG